MTVPDGYRAVHLSSDRAAEMLEITQWAFSVDVPPEDVAEWSTMVPFSRARGIEIADPSRGDVGSLVASNATFTYRMRVPGGAHVPCAGLSWVGVHAGHRRRGLLRTMMTEHLASARERGEPISALYAAESEIYQRFGYGLAATNLTLKVPRKATLRDVPGADGLTVRLSRLDPATHAPLIQRVQEHLPRPGSLIPDHEGLADLCADPASERRREGHERPRIVTVHDGDEPVAYAVFRRKGAWSDAGMPEGTVTADPVAALTPQAARRLWSVLADLDLMSTLVVTSIATDDALVHLLSDLRATAPALHDNVWLRLVDVPAALAARRYLADVDAVLAVDDALLPANAGPWRLTVRGGTATLAPAPGAAPDVSLGVDDLASAYLGRASLTALASAGRVRAHTPALLPALSAAFGSDLQPVSNLGF